MKRCFLLTLILTLIPSLVVLLIPANGFCEKATGNINFAIGVLQTSDDFSEAFDLDKRIKFGATCDVKKETYPISITFEYFLSYGNSKTTGNSYGLLSNMDVKLYCTETYIGVKKIFDRFPCLRPFVGGGLYLVNMYIDISYDDELKNGIGGWVGAGVYVALSKHLDVGLEGRWSYAKIDVFGMKLDTGGIHFNLLVGYHF